MIEINEITYQDTFIVRHPVLRSGKPIESCFFEGDDLASTKHFGLFVNKKITGVASVFKNKNANFNAQNPFQIRGMAVVNDFQKKGLGEQLLVHCEKYITEQKGDIIWLNARQTAVFFYEKQNYIKTGDPFLIADIGLHYSMIKKIGESAYE